MNPISRNTNSHIAILFQIRNKTSRLRRFQCPSRITHFIPDKIVSSQNIRIIVFRNDRSINPRIDFQVTGYLILNQAILDIRLIIQYDFFRFKSWNYTILQSINRTGTSPGSNNLIRRSCRISGLSLIRIRPAIQNRHVAHFEIQRYSPPIYKNSPRTIKKRAICQFRFRKLSFSKSQNRIIGACLTHIMKDRIIDFQLTDYGNIRLVISPNSTTPISVNFAISKRNFRNRLSFPRDADQIFAVSRFFIGTIIK